MSALLHLHVSITNTKISGQHRNVQYRTGDKYFSFNFFGWIPTLAVTSINLQSALLITKRTAAGNVSDSLQKIFTTFKIQLI